MKITPYKNNKLSIRLDNDSFEFLTDFCKFNNYTYSEGIRRILNKFSIEEDNESEAPYENKNAIIDR